MIKKINVRFAQGEDVILLVAPDVNRKIGRYLVDGNSVQYEVLNGDGDPTWHQASEIAPLPDSRRVFVVRGFCG